MSCKTRNSRAVEVDLLKKTPGNCLSTHLTGESTTFLLASICGPILVYHIIWHTETHIYIKVSVVRINMFKAIVYLVRYIMGIVLETIEHVWRLLPNIVEMFESPRRLPLPDLMGTRWPRALAGVKL